jgi:hypothetical protein
MGGLPLRMAYNPSWYWTISATACVSAADPERQHHIVSWTRVSLSVTRFAMYAPVVVLESAPVGMVLVLFNCVQERARRWGAYPE